jgi:hypothetical protein
MPDRLAGAKGSVLLDGTKSSFHRPALRSEHGITAWRSRGIQMTDQRDLKRRVRERQARTGESYTTALRRVREQRSRAVPVVELTEISDTAGTLGFKCRVMVMRALGERIDVGDTLRQLRGALVTTRAEPASWLMRAMVLYGERPMLAPPTFDDGLRFVRRARAGIVGFSACGRLLALPVETRRGAEPVIFHLWTMPRWTALILGSVDALPGEPEHDWSALPYGILQGP